MIRCLLIFYTLLWASADAQVTEQQSRKASRVIADWLIKSSGHYDFQSATTVNPMRAGSKFFGLPDLQMASDYGISYFAVPRTQGVTEAYETMGADTSQMKETLGLSRLHVNFGFANKYDFTFSYHLPTADKIQGWGVGHKRVLIQEGPFFLSYRLNYARSSREDYFSSYSFTNDLSVSLYLRLLDFYAGLRHWAGKVYFQSSTPALRLPAVDYFGTASEIAHYFGIIAATTTNSRVNFEANSMGKTYALSAKFSFHFDSLLPTMNNWFRDPRYIKQ